MLLVTSHPRVKLHGAFNEDCMAGHSFEISEGVAHMARYVESRTALCVKSLASPPSLGAPSKLQPLPERASFILQTHL